MENLGSYLLTSFGFGLLTLINPCVFPMIPLTFGTFTPGAEEKKRNFPLEAFLYVCGIVFTFSILGVGVSVLFGATGITRFATNPFLNIGLGFIFLGFAYAFWGWDFFNPTWMTFLSTYLEKNTSGYLGLLAKGLILSLTTFTCTMPFIGSVLVTASKGEWFFPLLGMISYSLAFSIPFVFLAGFPTLLSWLPNKAGNWNVKMRGVIAILEVIASIKFFSNADLVWGTNIISRDIFLLITIFFVIIIFLYVLNFIHSPAEHPPYAEKRSPIQIAIAVFFLVIAVYLGRGLGGSNIGILEAYLPPEKTPSSLEWNHSLEEARNLSKLTNKPILVNFTGWSCSNCRWMETNVLNQDEIKSSLKDIILVELYTDGDDPVEEKNQEYLVSKFKTFGIPYYALMDSEEKVLGSHEGVGTKEEFLQFLKSGTLRN